MNINLYSELSILFSGLVTELEVHAALQPSFYLEAEVGVRPGAADSRQQIQHSLQQ